MLFRKKKPQCSVCGKEIYPNKEIFLKLRYPSYEGIVGICKYIENETTIYCKKCSSI
ncbi:Fe3+ hydroxamate ABC transporter substrate-binding protein [Roseburia sp. 1XD42-34]|nr:Fe3+ hydroxamate ABC transporter substrate-binding protein [Roseburia sp. 1XD42-34]RKI74544.1 Fe3+ hydroxamate ABC transporter substrate-binding protein [Clostridium sp. 1xD42-85]